MFTLERRTRGEATPSREPTESAEPSRQTPSTSVFPTTDYAAITTITQPSEIYGLVPGVESSMRSRLAEPEPDALFGTLPLTNEEGDPLDAIGSVDPRPSVISRNIVTVAEARALVTYFLHTLGVSGTFHFGLREGAYPLLERLQYLTPLLFSTMCHIAAQRIPSFHHLVQVLEADSAGPETDEVEDPTIDIELGIGPEEITALALRAVFTGDAAAGRSALTWARGLGKVRPGKTVLT